MTFRNWATLASLGVVMCFAALNDGGLDRPAWHWALLVTALISGLHFVSPSPHPEPSLDRFTRVTAGVFLALAGLQLIPLPPGMVHFLSPARAELWRAAQPVIGKGSHFITLSAVPDQTADYLMTLMGYAVTALTIRSVTLRFEGNGWIASLPILAVAAMEAILGFFQATGGAPEVAGTLPDRDHFTGLVELALPFAALFPVGILQREQIGYEPPAARAIQVSIFLGITGALVAGIVASQSRIGLMVSFAALLIAGTLAHLLRDWTVEYEVSEGWLRKWLPSAATALVIAAGLLILPTGPTVVGVSEMARNAAMAPETRMEIWRDTTDLIRAYPLFGCGLGGFESCFLRYKTAAPMRRVEYPHNDYLQVLAEAGVLGFAAGLLLVLGVLRRALRGARYAPSVEARYLAIASVASISAMLLDSVVNSNLYVPVNGMVCAWIMGIAGIHLRAPRPATRVSVREDRWGSLPTRSEFRTIP